MVTGSILNTLFILTAAHCLKYKIPSHLKVIAGDHHRPNREGWEQERNVSYVFNHLDYNWDTDVNDIALMVLSAPLEFNKHIASISYPKDRTRFQGFVSYV